MHIQYVPPPQPNTILTSLSIENLLVRFEQLRKWDTCATTHFVFLFNWFTYPVMQDVHLGNYANEKKMDYLHNCANGPFVQSCKCTRLRNCNIMPILRYVKFIKVGITVMLK